MASDVNGREVGDGGLIELFGEGIGVLAFLLIGVIALCAFMFGAVLLILDLTVWSFRWWDIPLVLFYGFVICVCLGMQSRGKW